MVAICFGRDGGENPHLAVTAINSIYQRYLEYAAIQNSSLVKMSFSQLESIPAESRVLDGASCRDSHRRGRRRFGC